MFFMCHGVFELENAIVARVASHYIVYAFIISKPLREISINFLGS